jgi:pyruvate dehydrogenase E2 component (dihydrolipoamide acetyltransferase)
VSGRDFRLPDLGEGLEDAELVRWLVAEGDVVAVDQPLAEVLTAKATVELPSPFGGMITTLHHAVGDVVPVGARLVSFGDAGEAGASDTAVGEGETAAGEVEAGGTASAEPSASDGDSAPGPADSADGASGSGSGSVLVGYGTRPERRRRRQGGAGDASPTGRTGAWPAAVGQSVGGGATPAAGAVEPVVALGPAVLSPVVRRLARDLHVDLSAIEGSGREGVITRGDVELAAALSDVAVAGAAQSERIPIRGAHRQMAEHLARSRREIPEATVWVDADASGLLEARRAIDLANSGRPNGVGIASWIARFCILGLQAWPLLNSRIDGDEIVLSRRVNLGIAAQTDHGLVVPVVHDAEQLTLLELDDEIRRLATAARDSKLTRTELTGGTFTLNNYGVFGVDGSAAIINVPEVAIVGIGRIIDRPWVVAGKVQVRPVTELTLAFDHRVCDGGVAGGFLRFVADCVEQPVRLLTI